MSTKGKRMVKCPSCGRDFEADFWTVVRGDLDSELKEMIINGEFDLLLCPYCKKIFSFEDTFIYMDPSAELLVFVMPENSEGKEALMAKMKDDYEALKTSALLEKSISLRPYYFFGAGSLGELLLKDRDMEEETEVIAFIAAERGFSMKKLSPAFSRENNFPLSLPFSREKNFLETCREIYALNKRLERLGKIADWLEKEKKEPVFI